MNGDPSVFNLTDHVIGAGEQFTLRVDAQDNWSDPAPGRLEIMLYFEASGDRMFLASTTVETWWGWTTYTLNHTVEGMAGVGQKIGIELANVSAGGWTSWIGLDNVRLEVIPEPTTIALLSLGILGIRRIRRA